MWAEHPTWGKNEIKCHPIWKPFALPVSRMVAGKVYDPSVNPARSALLPPLV